MTDPHAAMLEELDERIGKLIARFDIIDFDGKRYVPVHQPAKSDDRWLITDAICLEDLPDEDGALNRYCIGWSLVGTTEEATIAWGYWTPSYVLMTDGKYNPITGKEI